MPISDRRHRGERERERQRERERESCLKFQWLCAGRKDVTFERLSLSARVCSVPQQPLDHREWKTLSQQGMAPLGLSQDEGGAGDLRLVLCYPEKQAGEAMEAFATRNSMHDKVYQHRKVLAMDEMVTDVLLLASEVKVRTRSDPNELAPDLPVRLKRFVVCQIGVSDEEGRFVREASMAEAALDPVAFTFLDDSVLDIIRCSPLDSPGMCRARALLARLASRQLYSDAGSLSIDPDNFEHVSTPTLHSPRAVFPGHGLQLRPQLTWHALGQNSLWRNAKDEEILGLVVAALRDPSELHAASESAMVDEMTAFGDEQEQVPDSEGEEEDDLANSTLTHEQEESGEEVHLCSQIAFQERFAKRTTSTECPRQPVPVSAPTTATVQGAGQPNAGQGGTTARLCIDDLALVRRHIHHGAKGSNPVDKIWFFYKDCDEADG
jgi:hypothetical protein